MILLRRVLFPTLGYPSRTALASPDLRTLNPSPAPDFFATRFSSFSLSFAICALTMAKWPSVRLLYFVPLSSSSSSFIRVRSSVSIYGLRRECYKKLFKRGM